MTDLSLMLAWKKKKKKLKILHTDLTNGEKMAAFLHCFNEKPGDILMCAGMLMSSLRPGRVLRDHL